MSTAHAAVVKNAPVKYKRDIGGISVYHDMRFGAAPCCCAIAPLAAPAPKSIFKRFFLYLERSDGVY
eukprot:CAMPEP_0197184100 /NCGR_PEP_ID=MMETSP1423-20130617/9185_1 /TAXON_ID=476441 /ORGANISM="Pseudo-nitzschia heimii, Strain UNC1101" /LENGTH=66 /DNA_ID=CAMNT_0042634829 /DNA_START=741 /DNA_END=941 /DNA_ORIENTATION=+